MAVAVVLVLICVILLTVLIYIPIPHAFAGSFETRPDLGTPTYSGSMNETFPVTASVRLSFSTAGQVPVAFSVRPEVDPDGQDACYVPDADQGSCEFSASQGTYVLAAQDLPLAYEVSVTVNVSGTYSEPLI